MFTYQIL